MTGLEIALVALLVGCGGMFCILLFIYLSGSDSQKEEVRQAVKERELNISEPVLSFVETVKQNPKRFSLKQLEVKSENYYVLGSCRYTEDFYQLKDKQTSEVWDVSVKSRYSLYQQRSYSFPGWLTRDECNLIYNTFVVIYRQRIERISQRKLEQKAKDDQKERNRLKEVYCNK